VLKPSPTGLASPILKPAIAHTILIPKVPTVQPKFAPIPKIGNVRDTGIVGGLGLSRRPNNVAARATPYKPVRVHTVQPKYAAIPRLAQAPAVLQAKAAHSQPKFYPNLNPAAAAVKADPGEFMRLERGFDETSYRMRHGADHGLLVPNTKFIFVRTLDGEMVMHQRYRHPVLAQGKPVLYAGEAAFNNGKLNWWSNGSGNYRPDSEHAEQASLPMEKFFSYEDVLKGKTR
jgi:hypothetical protein